jgi:hydroxymethylglutaryl-CoA lyase
MAAPVVAAARLAEVPVRGYVSMCFGDPWEGSVDPSAPAEIAARLAELGCSTISLGDTIGVATAGQVIAVLDRVAAAGVPRDRIALHMHDTYGQALANVLAGLEAGITEFDSSAGGLGGCPYAKSATGNLATEDLVWMLDGLYVGAAIAFTSGSGSGHLNGFGISVVVVGGRGTHGRHRRLRPRPKYRSSLG